MLVKVGRIGRWAYNKRMSIRRLVWVLVTPLGYRSSEYSEGFIAFAILTNKGTIRTPVGKS